MHECLRLNSNRLTACHLSNVGLGCKFNSINDCIGLKELQYLRELQDFSNSSAPLAYRYIEIGRAHV